MDEERIAGIAKSEVPLRQRQEGRPGKKGGVGSSPPSQSIKFKVCREFKKQ